MKTLIWRTWLILALPFVLLGMLIRCMWHDTVMDQTANLFFAAYIRAWKHRPKWDEKGGWEPGM